ncbi:putative pentatricopeptide repeat-containing protein [Hibiscus syriacus]|uniref:pectinesterase n=1 Tax=Hibiscus syriacus TaxID=106335 RepID=A0A6A2YEH6_HIBSY|nr:probable pectinesterase 66 [Hibiscus syriacus]KAE8671254.1 putative pentatricopeptide repeat-containing protein [Hibiscus syriacus]
MQCLFAFVLILLLLCFGFCESFECKSGAGHRSGVAYTIWVDQSGKGEFKSVQQAIDSVPCNNNKWIRIYISPGIFREKVTIPADKPCIFLEGSGSRLTIIEWDDHKCTSDSATFSSYPDNIVAKGISFKNIYNIPPVVLEGKNSVVPALAARIYGDKSAFYSCGFFGLQDTLWDVEGRHYFYGCYIEGGIDFIFGSGQSIYESCQVNFTLGKYAPQYPEGYITAQGRSSSDDPSGFVFKTCAFVGTGKTYLGRAYGAYSRVIIYRSMMSDIIVPSGWDAWDYVHQEGNLVYEEANCRGAGANTSGRVPWMKKLGASQLHQFVRRSYIDKEGWIDKLPIKS